MLAFKSLRMRLSFLVFFTLLYFAKMLVQMLVQMLVNFLSLPFVQNQAMANIKEITAKIVALHHRKRKDSSVPLYLRIIYNRTKKEYTLKMTVEEHNFNQQTGRFIRNKEGNIALTAIQYQAEKIIKALQEANRFTFHAFEEDFFIKSSTRTVYQYVEDIIQQLEEENRLGTARTYKNLLAELRRFKRNASLQFTDINVAFLQQLTRHMKGKGMKQTSIGIYMRSLRAAYNKAIKDKLIAVDLYPFREYKIRSGSAEKIALTKDDILKMYHYATVMPVIHMSLRESIHYFLLSYFLRGINFTDMCKLRWDRNFLDNRIIYYRQKTERSHHQPKSISIEVKEHIAAILEQYTDNRPYILPVLSPGLTVKTERYRIHGKLKKINQDIRFVAQQCDIAHADQITFYTARHTYATVLKYKGVSVEQISEGLRHSSINTTKAYLRSFGDEVLDRNDDYLI